MNGAAFFPLLFMNYVAFLLSPKSDVLVALMKLIN